MGARFVAQVHWTTQIRSHALRRARTQKSVQLEGRETGPKSVGVLPRKLNRVSPLGTRLCELGKEAPNLCDYCTRRLCLRRIAGMS